MGEAWPIWEEVTIFSTVDGSGWFNWPLEQGRPSLVEGWQECDVPATEALVAPACQNLLNDGASFQEKAGIAHGQCWTRQNDASSQCDHLSRILLLSLWNEGQISQWFWCVNVILTQAFYSNCQHIHIATCKFRGVDTNIPNLPHIILTPVNLRY